MNSHYLTSREHREQDAVVNYRHKVHEGLKDRVLQHHQLEGLLIFLSSLTGRTHISPSGESLGRV
jgi:hypothetical protein